MCNKRRSALARLRRWVPLGCLLIPAVALASTLSPCRQIGPDTILITEKPLVPGTPEPLTEATACLLPAGFAPPATTMMFDLMEPNPSNPLLPVSDYFNVTSTGLVVLVSDPLEVGLAARPLATSVPEVGPDNTNGAIIKAGGINFEVISDRKPRSPISEPSSVVLLLTGVGLLGLTRFCRKAFSP